MTQAKTSAPKPPWPPPPGGAWNPSGLQPCYAYNNSADSIYLRCGLAGHRFKRQFPALASWVAARTLAKAWRRKAGGTLMICPVCSAASEAATNPSLELTKILELLPPEGETDAPK